MNLVLPHNSTQPPKWGRRAGEESQAEHESTLRIGEYPGKSRTMVRGPCGTGEEGNEKLTLGCSYFFIICMHVCSTLRLNYGKPEDLDNLWASHRGFPTSSRNFRAIRCYLGARGTGSLAETAEGLTSSPLPPVALRPGFCVWEGVASSPLTWERFALDLVSPAAMT